MTLGDKIERLRQQGVVIPAPETLEIGEEVVLDGIRGPDTILHAGTRLFGASLRIMPGCRLGAEGPVTVEDCALGPKVSLKGGYFSRSVFLEGASMGLGAHVRAGCLLEEQANAAHTVGLKQTILLPFVTLGSLINFCDVLMAGGTSRADHSEVGSSFIHFNFTPFGRRGDKATPSLVGDVPRGVMLRSARIFLGGQGGLVGPLHIDYGTVLAAGFVYRHDHGPDELVVGERLTPVVRPFSPLRYGPIRARVIKNLRYLGNLIALWHWYGRVRLPLAADPSLSAIYQAAQRLVADNIAERIEQLGRLAQAMEDSIAELERDGGHRAAIAEQRAFVGAWPDIEQRLRNYPAAGRTDSADLAALRAGLPQDGTLDYLRSIQNLRQESVAAGRRWLEAIVEQTVQLL